MTRDALQMLWPKAYGVLFQKSDLFPLSLILLFWLTFFM